MNANASLRSSFIRSSTFRLGGITTVLLSLYAFIMVLYRPGISHVMLMAITMNMNLISKPDNQSGHKPPVVREVTCKTILNRWRAGDYSLNCYVGCQHACAYCYARYMEQWHEHEEPWGEFVDVKINAVEVLKRQLRKLPPGGVFVSSACDAWQPVEEERRLTRACCAILLEHGFHLDILTKNARVLHDLDLFHGHDVAIGVTITTLEPQLARLWEPHASPVAERLRIIREVQDAGLPARFMFGPLLPFLSDTPDALRELFSCAKELGVDTAWVDALNPRPCVWLALEQLLLREFPSLHERYRRVLFVPNVRAAYLEGLNRRIRDAAKATGMLDKIAGLS